MSPRVAEAAEYGHGLGAQTEATSIQLTAGIATGPRDVSDARWPSSNSHGQLAAITVSALATGSGRRSAALRRFLTGATWDELDQNPGALAGDAAIPANHAALSAAPDGDRHAS